MPSYSHCEGRSLDFYSVSAADSSRCAKCVRLGRSRCDIQGISPAKLRKIASQY
ncbi:uncharacterized protein BCR38DRAFT_421239 [Pseudomassariella vexata]|uniref:Uncharacterized protein n=1 Tax=Pseudomassariella vexata TaxID=1141098 RepID=A0A1Y2EAI0_9PEZI|nr:uncharacterized protein BCR38DRAFT_423686 [Pseudomassariella vexata]XP_040720122.1 uncharacterized protein BCR38DRAFT_421239 [Pseudomassariella vexata]ORY68571.1 hypothetical protein BCR38DRAFT_423686 [Pseudomassariella vexata]ORY70172.1 hypothetical protein BCR38DRAFT_421239 [Pseudomassariella vexata]